MTCPASGPARVRLADAVLCPDCSCIGDDPHTCHACGNALGLLMLITVLNRSTPSPSTPSRPSRGTTP